MKSLAASFAADAVVAQRGPKVFNDLVNRMSPITAPQFWAWNIFTALAFGSWMFLDPVWGDWVMPLFLTAGTFIMMSSKEYRQSVPKWQVALIISLALAGFALLLAAIIWFPEFKPRGDARLRMLVRHPAIVVPFWALLAAVVYWHRKRSRTLLGQ